MSSSNAANSNAAAVSSIPADSHVNKPPIYDPPTPLSRILGWTFVIFLFFSSFWGAVVLLFPFVVFIPFALSVYRTQCDLVARSWFMFTIFWTEFVFGAKVFVTGDDTLSNPNESGIIIANHRTRLDWFFLWSFVARRGRLNNEKIILKDSLRKIPGWGWAMQTFCFLFISRKWENDEKHISAVLRRFADEHYPIQLLIFPEGTDLTPNTKGRSDTWALAQQPPLPKLEYTLYPRVKGLQHCVKLLKGTSDALYDVTIGYPDLIPQSEKFIAYGRLPRELHYHVKKYSLSSLPTDDEGMEKWILERWREKEENLKRFYKEKSFRFLSGSNQSATSNKDPTFEALACGVFWILLVLGCSYGLYLYSWFRWYTLIAVVLMVILSQLGGIEQYELAAAAKNKTK
eukprot:TRINITY_DN4953_c0_g1_i1.p1 TRINITY_DN4953_c0_g1~~TRINITY_DN4953_c0_g1_i1.p1  ORF type:complete len:401 (-),score=103.45 TRINITY_DN4953_c0_g1_i1:64-1266(-)